MNRRLLTVPWPARLSAQIAIIRSRQQLRLRDAFAAEKFVYFVPHWLQRVNSVRMALKGSLLLTASASDKVAREAGNIGSAPNTWEMEITAVRAVLTQGGQARFVRID